MQMDDPQKDTNSCCSNYGTLINRRVAIALSILSTTNSIRLHRASSAMNKTEVFAKSAVCDLDVLTEGMWA